MANLIKGLDKSFSDADQGWFDRRHSEEYEIFYQDAYTGGSISSQPLEPIAGPAVQRARIAGFLASFTYSNAAPWHTTGLDCIQNAERITGPAVFAVTLYLVIDVELIYYQPTGQWLDESVVHEAIAEAKSRGFRVLVYTAKWAINWWALHLGHVPQFDADGIYARYDNIDNIDPSEAPFCITGRWIGKQKGGDIIEGVTVDLNVFDESYFQESNMDETTISTEANNLTENDVIQANNWPAIYLVTLHGGEKYKSRYTPRGYQQAGSPIPKVVSLGTIMLLDLDPLEPQID